MKLSIPAGTTSKRIAIFIQDSSSTTGAGLTGLAFGTSGLTCYSWIDTDGNVGGTSQALQTATLGTWTTRGFKEKDATNMPGFYEFGVPDALLAAGVKWATLMFKGATNMAPLVLEIEVTAVSNQDAVRGGMTALPAAAAEAAGGLYTRGSGAGQINQPANGLVDVNTLRWNGTAVATPATAGIPDVNVKNINNVSAASVTTVAAVQGTTIAPTFTGSLIKSDVTDWNGTAVTAPNTAGTPVVDVGRINNVVTTPVTTVKAVQGLTTADTIVTYTGNTVQTGDSFARIGAAGAGLTALGDARVANLDATVSSRTKPADTQAAVTNLTNAPTAGDLTATMKASVTAAATAATPTAAAVTGNVGGSVGSVVAAVAITSNVKKNQALTKFQFLMTDSTTHAPKTGLTVSCTRSIDGAAYVAGTLVNVAEVGSGTYTVDFGAGDVNGNVIVLQATAAGADTTFERLVTQP